MDSATVRGVCIGSIGNVSLRSRLELIEAELDDSARDYISAARNAELHEIAALMGGDEELAVGGVTKSELVGLYSNQMVRIGKPARKIYDKILSGAPLGRCPFCDISYAATLDHFLPKASFPQFSVLPENLVPCCRDCNFLKLAYRGVAVEDLAIHPYFDCGVFVSDRWLFCSMDASNISTPVFTASPPSHWSSRDRSRVRRHFDLLDLAYRYSIEACSHLSVLREMVQLCDDSGNRDGVLDVVDSQRRAAAAIHVNSWEVAFLEAVLRNPAVISTVRKR